MGEGGQVFGRPLSNKSVYVHYHSLSVYSVHLLLDNHVVMHGSVFFRVNLAVAFRFINIDITPLLSTVLHSSSHLLKDIQVY